ncbi:unnamed protein product [Caretta caretta]
MELLVWRQVKFTFDYSDCQLHCERTCDVRALPERFAEEEKVQSDGFPEVVAEWGERWRRKVTKSHLQFASV